MRYNLFGLLFQTLRLSFSYTLIVYQEDQLYEDLNDIELKLRRSCSSETIHEVLGRN